MAVTTPVVTTITLADLPVPPVVWVAAATAGVLLWPVGAAPAGARSWWRARCAPRATGPGSEPDGVGSMRIGPTTVAVAVVAAGALVLLIGPAAAVGGPVVAGVFARRRSAARRRAAEAARLAALPAALDLCAVVLAAGGTVRDAVAALGRHGPGSIRVAAAIAVARADAGLRFDEALRGFRRDLGPGYQPLTGALLLGHEQGGSIGVLLGRLSAEANASRRRQGERVARRLPVALLGPLIVCSLPAVLLGAVAPLVLVSLAGLELDGAPLGP
ncbi:MAG: type II secretion system F family protein [Acidimicrobiales bacterium]